MKINSLLANKKIIVYGAGSTGHGVFSLILNKIANAEVFAFCDTFKSGTDKLTGLEVLSPSALEHHMDATIIIGISDYVKNKDSSSVEELLRSINIPQNQIIKYSEFLGLFADMSDDEFEWQKYADDVYNFDTNQLLIEKMAALIDTNDRSVVDLGAGNMYLKNFISPDVKYYPVDFKPRNSETIVCDLNKNEFPGIHADVYFLCAMLYYMEDPVSLLRKTAQYAEKKILIGIHNKNLSQHKEMMHVHGLKSYIYVDEISKCLAEFSFLLKGEEVLESHARRYMLFEK